MRTDERQIVMEANQLLACQARLEGESSERERGELERTASVSERRMELLEHGMRAQGLTAAEHNAFPQGRWG